MIEVYQPPLYFAWRMEHDMPYLVHFYITKAARSFKKAIWAIQYTREYFRFLGFSLILMNVRAEDARVRKLVEHHFRVKPYGQADGHQFYLVEV